MKAPYTDVLLTAVHSALAGAVMRLDLSGLTRAANRVNALRQWAIEVRDALRAADL